MVKVKIRLNPDMWTRMGKLMCLSLCFLVQREKELYGGERMLPNFCPQAIKECESLKGSFPLSWLDFEQYF